MNQRLFPGLAAVVVASATGVPLEGRAEQIESSDVLPRDNEALEAPAHIRAPVGHVPVIQAERLAPAFLVRDRQFVLSEMVQVISHRLDEVPAATVYVRDIPVLTFLGEAFQVSSDEVAADKSAATEVLSSTANEMAPMERAVEVATRLDRFHQSLGEPEEIRVRWETEREAFVIFLADTQLVSIDDHAMLPDTTEDWAEDALQATNRLRRLLGGAEPLTEIAGRPEPEPSPPAAPVRSNWEISSVFTGRASWYGPGFHGRRTANGERFNQNAMTAAHRTLPFGTRIRVTNLRNNRQVIVRVNDRGPFVGGRVLDLSAGAARAIGLKSAGVGPVRIEVLSR